RSRTCTSASPVRRPRASPGRERKRIAFLRMFRSLGDRASVRTRPLCRFRACGLALVIVAVAVAAALLALVAGAAAGVLHELDDLLGRVGVLGARRDDEDLSVEVLRQI